MGELSKRVIAWQKSYGRKHLPWQNTGDAYRVWLSEIMLQQTQVGTVIPYYQRFLRRFPDVFSLATAPQSEVLALWAGLGYYARARNVHRCAQQVLEQYGGCFPSQPDVLAGLPGIGRSTAAAIAVFAFSGRAAILDGNVKRVFARCFGVEGFPGQASVAELLWARAEAELPVREVAVYTQGLMDLGSMVCTRRQPRCTECPLRGGICVAEREGRQLELPTPKPRRGLPEREWEVCIFTEGKRVFLERRPSSGIWGGLLSLPEGRPEVLAAHWGLQLGEVVSLSAVKHVFTHFRLQLNPSLCSVKRVSGVSDQGGEWVLFADLPHTALPAPVRRLLLRLFVEHECV